MRASLKRLKSECESRSVLSGSLRPHGLYSPWNSPGQNTEVGGLSLLQGIFPTQGSNPGLLHCRRKPLEVIPKTILDGAVSWIAHCFSQSLIQAFVLDKNAAWSWEGCVKVTAQGGGGARVCAPGWGQGPSGSAGAPAPGHQGWGQGRGSVAGKTDPSLGRPPLPWPSKPVTLPASLPADRPPVLPNQVSLLLPAHSAELGQLPLMACRPGPPPGSGAGEGKLRKDL